MPLTPPRTLSPSKVSAFTDCALAFRFSAIDKVPEPPSMPATKGTLVHAALERLFALPPEQRTREAAGSCLDEAGAQIRTDPDFTGLALDEAAEAAFFADAAVLLDNYFDLEDPTTINPIGLELMLEVPIAGVALRGIIDRLELDADGELVVTDYKTGRAPSERQEQHRLDGVRFYAFLCEQLFGKRPARVQLLYLRDPVAIIAEPTEQSLRGLRTKVGAIWQAIEKACAADDFRPRPGPLCNWCAFKPYCPAHGGDPATAPSAAVDPPVDPAVPVATPVAVAVTAGSPAA
jgi:putative RecB family exonuclease